MCEYVDAKANVDWIRLFPLMKKWQVLTVDQTTFDISARQIDFCLLGKLIYYCCVMERICVTMKRGIDMRKKVSIFDASEHDH